MSIIYFISVDHVYMMTVADEVLISLALDVMKVDPRAMKTAIIHSFHQLSKNIPNIYQNQSYIQKYEVF